MAAVLAVVGIYFALSRSSNQSNEFAPGTTVFSGRILNSTLVPGIYNNASALTDEGCNADPKTGLANCTTKIQTKDGKLIFNYEHDMMEKPCLSIGDKVDVEILGNSSAMVRRTYWAGGGA